MKLISGLDARGLRVRSVHGVDSRSLIQALDLAWRSWLDSSVILHIQYPSRGFKWSIAPMLVHMLGRRCVVTIHEFSQARLLRRWAELLFALRSGLLIFTTEDERRAFCAARRIKSKELDFPVIPIGSNIDILPVHSGPRVAASGGHVLSFGLIREGKGIEQFIEAAKRDCHRRRYLIAGKCEDRYQSYLKTLIKMAGAAVEWHIDPSDADLSKIISSADIAFLPFPDGISERRGSVLPVAIAGLPVVTSLGRQTSKRQVEAFVFSTGVDHSLECIIRLLQDPQAYATASRNSYEYARSFDWNEIVSQHISLYSKFMAK